LKTEQILSRKEIIIILKKAEQSCALGAEQNPMTAEPKILHWSFFTDFKKMKGKIIIIKKKHEQKANKKHGAPS